MASMKRGEIECEAVLYNDDNGYGLTLCEEKITPFDIGPREEPVTCPKCLEIAKRNEQHEKNGE